MNSTFSYSMIIQIRQSTFLTRGVLQEANNTHYYSALDLSREAKGYYAQFWFFL